MWDTGVNQESEAKTAIYYMNLEALRLSHKQWIPRFWKRPQQAFNHRLRRERSIKPTNTRYSIGCCWLLLLIAGYCCLLLLKVAYCWLLLMVNGYSWLLLVIKSHQTHNPPWVQHINPWEKVVNATLGQLICFLGFFEVWQLNHPVVKRAGNQAIKPYTSSQATKQPANKTRRIIQSRFTTTIIIIKHVQTLSPANPTNY